MGFKLTYFNARARGEIIRLIFAQAGVEYEDNRVEQADWPELKPKMKYGCMPELQDGDFVLGQSGAIARYVANKYGLGGKDLMEQALVDSIADALADVFNAFVKILFTSDEEQKAELNKKFGEKTLPTVLPALEKMLKENGGKYMVGNDLTYADICVYNLIPGILSNPDTPKELVEGCTCLQDLCTRVGELPNIKKWVETRPETEF